ncbi:unnamed protein product [Chrysodeixis includens]|uniref:Peptidase S1 domain-containing protein n=1 Tax=Chrysodeixis includens TaxID=689277 RepID=A0A9P0G0K5_CHRIL|nr:unnamed protein product [Chrysodeixis includens]
MYKAGILVFALLVGSLAVPTPDNEDKSLDQFFFDAPDSRIVGGTEAAAGSHRHMVALTTGLLVRSFLCGGSLVTQRTVLTAAHCIAAVFSWGSLSSSLRVTVGTNRWSSGGQTYSVSRNVTHANYVSNIIKNDIGILITSSNVALNNNVQPVALNFNYVGGGVPVRAAGWGRIRGGGPLSATLLEVQLSTLAGNACVSQVIQASQTLNVAAPPVQPHIELCTFRSEGFGTCNGDSGSALTRVDNGQQVGIVSWGFPCARGAPDMFVRVSAYQSWVASNLV